MTKNYYPLDFEAQYEDTSQKMIEISKKFKEAILNSHPPSTTKIQEELQDIQNAIQACQLCFRKESIYSQFASGQLKAERFKQPPEMCPQCGEELKKPSQCQFCAQLFCKKCCYRSRSIPFFSKESRLCCEQCHWKFVKLFDNADFYQEKEKLINVLNFVKNKSKKLVEKIESRKDIVEEIRNQRRNEKIKEKNVQKKIQDEEKALIKLREQFKQVIAEKADKIRKEQEQRKNKQKQQQLLKQKEKIQKMTQTFQQQKKEIIQSQKMTQTLQKQIQQEQRQRQREQRQKKDRQIEEQKRRKLEEQQRIKIQQILQRQKEEMIKKQFEEELRKKNEELQLLKRQIQIQSNKQKQILQSQQNAKKSEKESITMTQKQEGENGDGNQKLVNTSVTSKSNKQKSVNSGKGSEESLKQSDKQLKSNEIKQSKINQYSREGEDKKSIPSLKGEESEDPLERSLAKMLRLTSKEQDGNQSVSMVSKTSKNVMDMSVNELLGMRIPVPNTNLKLQKLNQDVKNDSRDQKQLEEPGSPLSPPSAPNRHIPGRNSLNVEATDDPDMSKQEVQINRKTLIQNSSLLSSTHKENDEPVGFEPTGKKCECLLM